MGELENCVNCGKLFVRLSRPVCQDCYKEEEEKFQIVYEFMKKRENRQATVLEIVEGTGVEEELIIKFVRENRLRASQFPNLTYPCDRCGQQIKEGKLCSDCSTDLSKDLKKQEEIETLKERQKAEERERQRTYFAVDKFNKKD
ncbi:TIGR03826 family flagellar region protein [Amphibacillus jilinensis]|uniref:TIGR03826 family flagellar region protein n=1 Tax=Amphibacillus jilinensis TaxID=1216008 RepID=UPI00030785F8|nr:TIGR03826 family flagellar region protein [Amphibacillus jilinensis]